MNAKMRNREKSAQQPTLWEPIQEALMELVSDVPKSQEHQASNPEFRARFLSKKAATQAAFISASLSIPAGPLGFMTILPDLLGVWRIQRQLVTDIAGAFGRKAHLTQEQMVYCLFRHAASQAMRDLAIRIGERTILQTGSVYLVQRILRAVGVRISKQFAGRAVSRVLPVVGAVGVGGYSYYDTMRVSETAIKYFKQEAQALLKASSAEEKAEQQLIAHEPPSRNDPESGG